jgi:hypothetical protein
VPQGADEPPCYQELSNAGTYGQSFDEPYDVPESEETAGAGEGATAGEPTATGDAAAAVASHGDDDGALVSADSSESWRANQTKIKLNIN